METTLLKNEIHLYTIQELIEKHINEYKQGKKTFRQAVTDIDKDSTYYRMIYYSDQYAIFHDNNSKHSIKIQNITIHHYIQVSLEEILSIVSKVTEIPLMALKGKTRKREVVEARQAYFLLSMILTENSLSEIGNLVNRDHATVLHAKQNEHLKSIQNIIEKTQLL